MTAQAYKSFRLLIQRTYNANADESPSAAVSEWLMYEDEDGATANFMVGGTATASQTDGSYTPANAFDNNANSYWKAQSAATPAKWLRYDLPSAKVPRRMVLVSRDSSVYRPADFLLQASNDNGASWDNIASFRDFLSNTRSERAAILTRRFSGTARLADGSPATKVSLLRWSDLSKAADVVPSSDGAWSHVVGEKTDYLVLFFGPTGYRPIAEGPIAAPSTEA